MPASEESVRAELVQKVEASNCFVFDDAFAEVLKNFKKDKKRFTALYEYAKLFSFGSVKSNAAAKSMRRCFSVFLSCDCANAP